VNRAQLRSCRTGVRYYEAEVARITDKIHTFSQGVTLVGGGPASLSLIQNVTKYAPILVAADGGANHLVGAQLIPSAIIGDLDSLVATSEWADRIGDKLIHIEEQDSTDFQKCLARVDAPFFIGVGFLGGRMDHGLAALHALVADPRPIVLLSDDDAVFAAHSDVRLSLPVGERISIFPLRRVEATFGAGLKYPVDGLTMEAGAQIGTSNEAAASTQSFAFDRPGATVFLNPDRIRDALQACGALSRPAI